MNCYETRPKLIKCFCVWAEINKYKRHDWAKNVLEQNGLWKIPIGNKKQRQEYWWFLYESKLFEIFIQQNYINPIEFICDPAENILSKFDKWFTKKRNESMNNIALEMAKKNEKIFKPTSHSGIASLLSVLTRTMEKQGADITSIAKVQYAVCVQAGVYIPEEFLLDVAIALDVEDKEGNEK